MIAVTLAVTALVTMLNVTDVFPAGTTTAPGTCASPELDDRDTVSPTGPAGALSRIVPVTVAPPTAAAGTVRRATRAVRTSNVAVVVTDPYLAEMVTVVPPETGAVLIVVRALEALYGITTVDSTAAAAGSLEVSAMLAPDEPANPFRLSVAPMTAPPRTSD